MDDYSVVGLPVKSWDEYYYNVAIQTARNSKCLSRRIGAVLVRDKTIIGTGYNGPPRGVPHCSVRHRYDVSLLSEYKNIDKHFDKRVNVVKCPRQLLGYKSGEGLSWCPAGHSERNTLINSAREGISTKNASLFLTCGIPCSACMVEIINAGVVEVVVVNMQYYDSTSKYLLENSGVKIRMYDFI